MNETRVAVAAFAERLSEIKQSIKPDNGQGWHPSYSIHNVPKLLDILEDTDGAGLFDHLDHKVVLDIGPSDGDIGFFAESRGASVDMIDYGPASYNGLSGLYTMKRSLDSKANIYEIDVDTQFRLPRKYDIVLLLGILYHIKNPYYILEHLAKNTQFLLISTKVSDFQAPHSAPDRKPLSGPVAYLLDTFEANNDSTNFWVFSEAGLWRLLKRTGWSVVTSKMVGAPAALSDPSTGPGDRRAFCYLRSEVYAG